MRSNTTTAPTLWTKSSRLQLLHKIKLSNYYFYPNQWSDIHETTISYHKWVSSSYLRGFVVDSCHIAESFMTGYIPRKYWQHFSYEYKSLLMNSKIIVLQKHVYSIPCFFLRFLEACKYKGDVPHKIPKENNSAWYILLGTPWTFIEGQEAIYLMNPCTLY